MSDIQEVVTPFDDIIGELVAVTDERERLGSMRRGDEGYTTERRHRLEYDEAVDTETEAKRSAMRFVGELEDEIAPLPHRAIAIRAISKSVYKPPYGAADIREVSSMISEGTAAFDRVQSTFDQPSQVAAIVGHGTNPVVSLFQTHGLEDLKLGRLTKDIHAILTEGVSVRTTPLNSSSFPDFRVDTDAIFKKDIMGSSDPLRRTIADSMSEWDPAADYYRPPITRLGIQEAPAVLPDDLLLTDEERFAFRIALSKFGGLEWLDAPVPSQEFRERFTKVFADVFSDILSGRQPRDEVPKRRNSPSDALKYPTRTKPLGTYLKRELPDIYSAVGISAADVVTATKEEIAKVIADATPNSIYASLQIERNASDFFGRLFDIQDV